MKQKRAATCATRETQFYRHNTKCQHFLVATVSLVPLCEGLSLTSRPRLPQTIPRLLLRLTRQRQPFILMMPMPLIGRALTFRSPQQSRLIEWRFADIGLVENELKPLENEAFEQMAN
jgi:hypothetical protein